jgi:hypothetical protein
MKTFYLSHFINLNNVQNCSICIFLPGCLNIYSASGLTVFKAFLHFFTQRHAKFALSKLGKKSILLKRKGSVTAFLQSFTISEFPRCSAFISLEGSYHCATVYITYLLSNFLVIKLSTHQLLGIFKPYLMNVIQ